MRFRATWSRVRQALGGAPPGTAPAHTTPRPARGADCTVCGLVGGHGWVAECPVVTASREEAAFIRECCQANGGAFFRGDSPGAPRSG